MYHIEQNPEYNWNYQYISKNLNLNEVLGTTICPELAITKDFINKYLSRATLELLGYSIYLNSNIIFDIVKNHLNRQWNLITISFNPNITCDIINLKLNLSWN